MVSAIVYTTEGGATTSLGFRGTQHGNPLTTAEAQKGA